MGADLYIDKEDLDNAKGYFRDSYNNYNLLWQFDLSYWTDVAKRFCKDGTDLTVLGAEKWLKEMKEREPIFEQNMKDLLAGVNKVWDYKGNLQNDEKVHEPYEFTQKERLEMVEYYRKEYASLKKFLQTAIKKKTGAYCSL